MHNIKLQTHQDVLNAAQNYYALAYAHSSVDGHCTYKFGSADYRSWLFGMALAFSIAEEHGIVFG